MNKRKILVIGYYHRKNLGDDVFEHVLTNYFQKRWKDSEYSFVSVDDLKEITADTSAVLFGGGDLVNDYFIHKIEPFLSNKTCPWYAISIGIPYPKLIEKGYLDRFDYIIHRNQVDKIQLSSIYDFRTQWYPDISFLLQEYNNTNIIKYNNRGVKKIGIFLSRSIYNHDNPDAYFHIVNNIAKFLSDIAKKYTQNFFSCKRNPVYELYLFPFCTDEKDNHDDRLINKDVYEKILDYGCLKNVYLFEDRIHMNDIIPIFNSFYMTICTRFHAHMFSLMCKVPILSIYTTRKVENVLSEIGAKEYGYLMETSNYSPISTDRDVLMEKFNKIVNEYNIYKTKLTDLHNFYKTETINFTEKLDMLLFYLPRYLSPDEITKKALCIAENINRKLNLINNNYDSKLNDMFIYMDNNLAYEFPDNDNNDECLSHIDTGDIKKHFNNEKQEIKNYIIELISYELTGERKSPYHYGLSQQVFTDNYNLKESAKWILNHKYSLFNDDNYDFLNNTKFPLSDRKINVKYINNNLFNGYHRSGWSFVLDNLEQIHNPKGIIFDSYLDKTFGWEYDFLSASQIIPYQSSWIGIFHHTNNEDYSNNNLEAIFSKSNFIKSLNFCKGIAVFSQNNKLYIENKLTKLNLKIPLISLIHPTDLISNNLLFDYKIFKVSPVKKIIQIGAWLRNSYAIYNLSVPNSYSKYALKGKDMNNYFISSEDLDKIVKHIKTVASGKERASGCIIENKDVNKYIIGLTDVIKSNHKSVTVLENINNDQYDNLLKYNIVFINLVDASAVNTILECIVRNTPILVNRLPATEEYLGKNYPLFYDDMLHATKLLSDIKNIKKGYKYLLNMNKEKFTIDYFLNTLVSSEFYRKL